MADFQITIKGIPELEAKLGRAAAVATIRPPMERAVRRIQADLAKYPSPPAGTKYRRTGTLGRRWTAEVRDGGLTGVVGNNTPYAQWVEAAEYQAKVHQGRWPTDEEVLEKEKGAIVADFEKAIEDALG